jgi:hypothetical protein
MGTLTVQGGQDLVSGLDEPLKESPHGDKQQ